MTRIILDPPELTSVAAALRSTAVEAAQVGSALSHCVACAMPPDVESLVNQIVATTDALLDDMARRMQASANDLLVRAGVATQDSLTTASVATATGFGGGFGGMTLGGTVIGAASSPKSVAELTGGAGGPTVGGLVYDTRATSPFATTWNSAPALFSGPSPRPMTAMLNPATTSPALARFASGMDGAGMGVTTKYLQPSISDIAKQRGRPVSLDEYGALNFPGFNGNVFAVSSGIGLMMPMLGGG